jgi:hypothetical protein
VIAFEHNAAPRNSLFEILAAAIPADGAKAATESPFHSMLQAVTDAEDQSPAVSAIQAISAQKDSPAVSSPTGAVATVPQRAVISSFTLNVFRPSLAPDHIDKGNSPLQPTPQATATVKGPVLLQSRTATAPATLNIFRPTRAPYKNGEEDLQAPSTPEADPTPVGAVLARQRAVLPAIALNIFRPIRSADEIDQKDLEGAATSEALSETAGPVLPQQKTALPLVSPKDEENASARSTLQSAAVVDSGTHTKIKPAKKDATVDSAPTAIVTAPPQQTTVLPIALNIFRADDSPETNESENTETRSAEGDRPTSGQTATQPRSALSNAPPLKPEDRSAVDRVTPRSAPEAEPEPDRPPTVDASPADVSLSKLQPAFEMRLQPALPEESAAPSSTVAPGKPEISQPANDSMPEPAQPPVATASATVPALVPAVAQAAPSSSRQGDGSHHPEQERAREAAAATGRPEAGAETAQTNFDINATTPPQASTVSPTPAATRSEPPAETAPQAPVPEPAAAAPATHDIKLELNGGGGQRVEVHLTERGGDVHVAVRTADERLSGAMRDDLPALAAKLETSGFRADAWQPGPTSSNESRAFQTGAGNNSQDSQERGGQNQQQKQDTPQPQHPKNLANAPNRKSDRKDFAWLLQTYR